MLIRIGVREREKERETEGDRQKEKERGRGRQGEGGERGMLGVSLQGNKINCCCNILIKGRLMC